MAVLKQIKFGNGSATPIAQTVVAAASESVLSVVGTNTGLNDVADPSYAVDLRIDNHTLVKSTDTNKVLKVGTVPATQVSVADSGDKFAATNVETALSELKDDIAGVSGAAKSYKIVSVANPASTNYAEYKIQEKAATGTWGDVTDSAAIIVPKDNAFVTAQLGHTGATVNQSTGAITDGPSTGAEVLLIEYKNGEGVYTLVEIPVADFLRESEFKNGLQVNNGEVSVKIDAVSEKDSQETPVDFLTVSADGVKISGIKDEIDRKIAALDVTDTAVDGQYVSSVSETDGKITVSRANVSDAVLNGYAKGTKPASTAIAATDDVKGAIAKLEHQIDDAKAAATTKVVEGTDAGNNLEITSATSQTDGSVTYTVNLTDVASKAALDAEIAARKAVDGQNGDTYAANGSANYISGATSLNDADVKLDAALKAEETRAKAAETAIDSAVGLTKDANSETRSFTPTTNYGGTGTSAATSVMDNMQKIDTALKAVSDKADSIQYKVNGTTLEFYGMTEHS